MALLEEVVPDKVMLVAFVPADVLFVVPVVLSGAAPEEEAIFCCTTFTTKAKTLLMIVEKESGRRQEGERRQKLVIYSAEEEEGSVSAALDKLQLRSVSLSIAHEEGKGTRQVHSSRPRLGLKEREPLSRYTSCVAVCQCR